MNGRMLVADIKADRGEFFLVGIRMGKKFKDRAVRREDVFCLIYRNGRKEFCYERDTTKGRKYTIEQMKQYIAGEVAARKYYHALPNILGGAVVGATGVYLGFWGLAIPAIYTGVVSFIRPRGPGKLISGQQANDPYFRLGYKDEASRIKTRRVAKAAIAGLISGWIYKVVSGGLN